MADYSQYGSKWVWYPDAINKPWEVIKKRAIATGIKIERQAKMSMRSASGKKKKLKRIIV